jgi:hypothetical protein
MVGNPVSMPVSLAVGEVKTPEFRIYVNQYYNISIEAKKRLPLGVLDCMLGISTGPLDPYNCGKGEEPLIQANWILWQNNLIIDQGSSEDHKGHGGWGNESVECFIGSFRTKTGGGYFLTMNFTRDGTPLAVTDPHLKVNIADAYYGIAGTLYIFPLFVLIEAIGMVLLISSAVRCWRNRGGLQCKQPAYPVGIDHDDL